MKNLLLAVILLGMLLAGTAAFADKVVGSADAGWLSFPSALNENPSDCYWDNGSWDGKKLNIGYLLSGTSGSPKLNADSPHITPDWWGEAYSGSGGGADSDFYFKKDDTYLRATLNFEVSQKSGINEFGWYDKATGVTHTLFGGSIKPGGPGSGTNFITTASYGFYLKTTSGTYFTQSSKNGGEQHFALFQGASKGYGVESYWFGVEDLPLKASDKDFNDAVVKVQAVPEPSSILLLGSSMVGTLGYLLRRRRQLR